MKLEDYLQRFIHWFCFKVIELAIPLTMMYVFFTAFLPLIIPLMSTFSALFFDVKYADKELLHEDVRVVGFHEDGSFFPLLLSEVYSYQKNNDSITIFLPKKKKTD